jgi:flagellar motor switch protein FliM
MSKVLTQEEIDALLRSAGALERETPAVPRGSGPVVPYNFRRPDRVSRDQIRSLHVLHDRFARNVATALSAYLRTVTTVSVASVEQLTYAEFLGAVPDPTAFYGLSMGPLDGMGALELNPSVAFGMIDRMLGGSGRVTNLQRALTEIEQNVIDAVVKLVVENLSETWRAIADVRFAVAGRETRPRMLHVSAPSEVVVHLAFDVQLGEARGMFSVCVPATLVEGLGAAVASTTSRGPQGPTAEDRRHLVESLGRVVMPVAAFLDSTLTARQLLALKRGDVVSLGQSVREPLDVRVRGAVKFKGRLTASDHRVGVRIETSTPQALPAA